MPNKTPKYVWIVSENRFLALKPRSNCYVYVIDGATQTLKSNQWVSYYGKSTGSHWYKWGSSSKKYKTRN